MTTWSPRLADDDHHLDGGGPDVPSAGAAGSDDADRGPGRRRHVRRRWIAAATVAVAMLWTVLLEVRPGGVLGAAIITALTLAAIAVVLVARRVSGITWRVGHDVWLAVPVLAVHLALSHLLVPAASAIIPLLGRQADDLVFTATVGLPDVVVALVAGACIAPLEELWWRGTLQPMLRPNRSAWSTIALTTAIFVAFHLPTGQLPLMGAALLGGIAWGWLRERTEGLAAPMLAHAGWTAAMVLLPPT